MIRSWLAACAATALVAGATGSVDAHKPITSPFTFSADVQPILRDRCVRCHVPGGVAPMSLLTHIDTVPWGESMRGELIAGHMPPWAIDHGAAQFRNAGGITARELNVLLTWLTGGTPPGDITAPTDESRASPVWALGAPDEVITLPRFTIAAEEQERVAEFTLPGAAAERSLRAIDLLPGNPAIVRSATIEVRRQESATSVRTEQLLALWVPGDEASPPPAGALKIPPGADLVVRVRYRKTWEYENKALTDQSRIGFYVAPASTSPVEAVVLSPGVPVTLSRAMRAVAIYPDATLADSGVTVTATRPDGRRQELIAFHPRRGWARRYWFREPVSIPRGTSLSVRVVPDSPALLPPGFVSPRAASPSQGGRVRVTVDVVQ